eukprot:2326046-Prymnesium_polylepis.1
MLIRASPKSSFVTERALLRSTSEKRARMGSGVRMRSKLERRRRPPGARPLSDELELRLRGVAFVSELLPKLGVLLRLRASCLALV